MRRILPVLLCLIFIGISYASAVSESLTYDEIVDREEGENALLDHTFAIDPYNPPLIKELTALPFILGLPDALGLERLRDTFLPARMVVTLLGSILLTVCYFVANKYFGLLPALLSTFLFAFEPTLLGHSHYVTLDTGTALFFFLSYVTFLSVCQSPRVRNFLLHGVFLGLSMGARISVLAYSLFIFPSAVVFAVRKGRRFLFGRRYLVAALPVGFFVLWSLYFFTPDVVLVKHDDPARVSNQLLMYGRKLKVPVVETLIVGMQNRVIPLGNYIQKLKNNTIRATRPGPVFFWGSWYPESQWYFMIWNMVAKTPLPLLFLFLVGTYEGFHTSKTRRATVLFLLPFLAILLVSSGSAMNPQVRYVLPAYPFMLMIASIGLRWVFRKSKVLFVCILLWYSIGTLRQFPHFISYANELIPRNERYTFFTDSNIDWGQALPDLGRYAKENLGQISAVSYFGRDDGGDYGLSSDVPYGSYKFEDICAFHPLIDSIPADVSE
ncbi:MAG: glycosyltransferase family 39 protein, partial [bacterium]|nr:glycosyltransferase family 39 protein [bacterium]